MIGLLNLVFAFFFPGLIDWWLRWNQVAEPARAFRPDDFALAMASLAGILILGLGGVLVIGLSGRSVRRLYFSKSPYDPARPAEKGDSNQGDWSRSGPSNPVPPGSSSTSEFK